MLHQLIQNRLYLSNLNETEFLNAKVMMLVTPSSGAATCVAACSAATTKLSCTTTGNSWHFTGYGLGRYSEKFTFYYRKSQLFQYNVAIKLLS